MENESMHTPEITVSSGGVDCSCLTNEQKIKVLEIETWDLGAENQRLREVVKQQTEALKITEWAIPGGYGQSRKCPMCRGLKPAELGLIGPYGHKKECIHAKAIKAGEDVLK